jgi:hypothetical protein
MIKVKTDFCTDYIRAVKSDMAAKSMEINPNDSDENTVLKYLNFFRRQIKPNKR